MDSKISTGEIEIPMEPLDRGERALELLKELQNGSARRYDMEMRRFVADPSRPVPVRPSWWGRAQDILADDFLEPGDE
jgi:hypothetical protein